MSPVLRVAGYTLSVLLHVGAGALVIAWSVPDWTQPLFVDLVEPPDAPATGAPASRAVATRGPAAPAAPPSARHVPVSAPDQSPPDVSPKSAASSGPLALSEPQAAVASSSPRTPEPAAADPTPPASTPPASSPAGGRAVASEPGATGPGAGGSLVGTDAGTNGSPGTPLALVGPGGEAGGPGPEYGQYLRRFRERIANALVYPLAAQRQGVTGTVELYVRLEANGRVSDVRVVRSSSHEILDEAALETIRRVGALPFPDSLPRRPLLIRVPLVFELR